MPTISRIKSHARSGVRRVLESVAVKLSTFLLMAFAIGAVAGMSPGGGQGTYASALLSGGLIKSAQAQNKSTAAPGARQLAQLAQLAKTGDAEGTAPRWRVISVRGTAEVREGSKVWHRWSSAKPGRLMNDRAQVRTGRDGEVIISNGHDTLTLAADSTLELPAPGAERGLTQVIQKRGTINYDIESRLLPGTKEDRPSLKEVLFSTQRIRGRFEVVTPFLIVGVKGTNFDVDVDANGASVDVSEGVVEVDTPDGGGAVTIVAGQMANVATHSGSTVSVTTSTSASAAPAATSSGGKTAAAPTGPAVVTTSNGSSGNDGASTSSGGSATASSSSGGASVASSGGGASGSSGSGDGASGSASSNGDGASGSSGSGDGASGSSSSNGDGASGSSGGGSNGDSGVNAGGKGNSDKSGR